MYKLQGTIQKVFPTESFNNFDKRLFWLHSGHEKFSNTWCLELWKNDTKMIENYREGDFITAYIDIKGKHWVRHDGKEGVMNTLKCWNIEKDGIPFKEITESNG